MNTNMLTLEQVGTNVGPTYNYGTFPIYTTVPVPLKTKCLLCGKPVAEGLMEMHKHGGGHNLMLAARQLIKIDRSLSDVEQYEQREQIRNWTLVLKNRKSYSKIVLENARQRRKIAYMEKLIKNFKEEFVQSNVSQSGCGVFDKFTELLVKLKLHQNPEDFHTEVHKEATDDEMSSVSRAQVDADPELETTNIEQTNENVECPNTENE
jgi:hypothetical protein